MPFDLVEIQENFMVSSSFDASVNSAVRASKWWWTFYLSRELIYWNMLDYKKHLYCHLVVSNWNKTLIYDAASHMHVGELDIIFIVSSVWLKYYRTCSFNARSLVNARRNEKYPTCEYPCACAKHCLTVKLKPRIYEAVWSENREWMECGVISTMGKKVKVEVW